MKIQMMFFPLYRHAPKCHDRPAPSSPARSARTCQDRNARMCPSKSASRCPSKTAPPSTFAKSANSHPTPDVVKEITEATSLEIITPDVDNEAQHNLSLSFGTDIYYFLISVFIINIIHSSREDADDILYN